MDTQGPIGLVPNMQQTHVTPHPSFLGLYLLQLELEHMERLQH